MEAFDAPGCCSFFAVIGQIAQASAMLSNIGSSPADGLAPWYGSLSDSPESMPAEQLTDLRENILPSALSFCRQAKLTLTARQIEAVCEQLTHVPVKHSEVIWTLLQLKTLMTSEMGDRFSFVFLSSKQKTSPQLNPWETQSTKISQMLDTILMRLINAWLLIGAQPACFTLCV